VEQGLCGLVQWRSARGGEPEEEEGAGVKMAKLPRSPIYKHGAEIVGAEVVFHYGDSYCAQMPRVGTTWAAVWITVPLGKLWQ
jgi:hypothetical protein